MPLYFFNITDSAERPDPDGELLADDVAAKQSAVAVMHEMLRDRSDYVAAGGAYTVSVTNEAGRELWRLRVQGQ